MPSEQTGIFLKTEYSEPDSIAQEKQRDGGFHEKNRLKNVDNNEEMFGMFPGGIPRKHQAIGTNVYEWKVPKGQGMTSRLPPAKLKADRHDERQLDNLPTATADAAWNFLDALPLKEKISKSKRPQSQEPGLHETDLVDDKDDDDDANGNEVRPSMMHESIPIIEPLVPDFADANKQLGDEFDEELKILEKFPGNTKKERHIKGVISSLIRIVSPTFTSTGNSLAPKSESLKPKNHPNKKHLGEILRDKNLRPTIPKPKMSLAVEKPKLSLQMEKPKKLMEQQQQQKQPLPPRYDNPLTSPINAEDNFLHFQDNSNYFPVQNVQCPEIPCCNFNPKGSGFQQQFGNDKAGFVQNPNQGQNSQGVQQQANFGNIGVLPPRAAAFQAPFVPFRDQKKPQVNPHGSMPVITEDDDGINFSFNPRPNFATEVTFTVEPRKKPMWQTMMNCGFTPVIYCSVPPCCLPGGNGNGQQNSVPQFAPGSGFQKQQSSSEEDTSSGSDEEESSEEESQKKYNQRTSIASTRRHPSSVTPSIRNKSVMSGKHEKLSTKTSIVSKFSTRTDDKSQPSKSGVHSGSYESNVSLINQNVTDMTAQMKEEYDSMNSDSSIVSTKKKK